MKKSPQTIPASKPMDITFKKPSPNIAPSSFIIGHPCNTESYLMNRLREDEKREAAADESVQQDNLLRLY